MSVFLFKSYLPPDLILKKKLNDEINDDLLEPLRIDTLEPYNNNMSMNKNIN